METHRSALGRHFACREMISTTSLPRVFPLPFGLTALDFSQNCSLLTTLCVQDRLCERIDVICTYLRRFSMASSSEGDFSRAEKSGLAKDAQDKVHSVPGEC